MDISIAGRRALVTGGNSGIGEAIVMALGGAGARVAVNFVSDPQAAERIVSRLRDGGGEALAVEADISDPPQVRRMFERLDEVWGGVDILVNNAGINGKQQPSWEIDLEDWRQVLEINLFGTFHCAREALRRMVPQGEGVILNITSVHEVIPWQGRSAYATSKAGISMLTRSLAMEAAPSGVRVLALAPGAVRTSINEEVWQDPERRQALEAKIPLRRIADPQAIASMALVLVSDAGRYVTASTVFVDGGMTAYPALSESQ